MTPDDRLREALVEALFYEYVVTDLGGGVMSERSAERLAEKVLDVLDRHRYDVLAFVRLTKNTQENK